MKKFLLLVLNMAAAMSLFAFSAPASAQLGSSNSDLVYTPVTPCRLLDTRYATNPAGTPIAAGSARSFVVWGVSNFAPQGGSATTNCGLTASSNTAAIAVNFTVVTPDTAGFITAYPANVARPAAATVNFEAGSIRGNSAILKNYQIGTPDITVYSTSNTHLVADVVGFYAKPVATALECINTTPITSAISQGPASGLYYTTQESNTCPAGYAEVALRCSTNSQIASARELTSLNGYCTASSPVSGYTLSVSRTCCRVPGR